MPQCMTSCQEPNLEREIETLEVGIFEFGGTAFEDPRMRGRW